LTRREREGQVNGVARLEVSTPKDRVDAGAGSGGNPNLHRRDRIAPQRDGVHELIAGTHQAEVLEIRAPQKQASAGLFRRSGLLCVLVRPRTAKEQRGGEQRGHA